GRRHHHSHHDTDYYSLPEPGKKNQKRRDHDLRFSGVKGSGLDKFFLTNVHKCSKFSNRVKPLRKKSSTSSEISESGRRWNCHMELMSEWPFEGSLKSSESRR